MDDRAIIRISTPQFSEVEVLDPEPSNSNVWGQANIFAGMIAQAVVAAQRAPKFSEAELDQLWAVAFEEWLEHEQKHGGARPRATRTAYAAAWADLRGFCRKHPRHLDGIDIQGWVADLRTRSIDPMVAAGLIKNGRREPGQVGLAPSTVNQYIAGVSSFYTFCQNYPVRAPDGSQAPLYTGLNPAKSQLIKRPRVKRMGQDVVWLNQEQLLAVRRVIRSAQTLADLERGVASSEHTVKELRDYALFTSYILTGGRNSEVRAWRWRDLTEKGGQRFYAWENKGKDGVDELPGPCWQAVQDYLRLAGRLEGIQPDDYIFQPTGDAILRMRRADGTPVVTAETWDRNRAISGQEANRLLRYYCRRAGIDNAGIHVHSLRHSASMLYKMAGASVEDRSRLLHHSSLDMTMRYDHEMSGQRNANWLKAASLLGL